MSLRTRDSALLYFARDKTFDLLLVREVVNTKVLPKPQDFSPISPKVTQGVICKEVKVQCHPWIKYTACN
jgi:hypothetical protein